MNVPVMLPILPGAPNDAAPRGATTAVDGDAFDAALVQALAPSSMQAVKAAHTLEEDAAAAAPPARSAMHATRDLDALDPQFRTRLDQVITHMEALGYRVRVLETHRTQERQDHLYAQGREAPGRVVTWTRNSNHTAGRATDLQVSGNRGYQVLANVAREFGLRTLGANDPGHIEMPRGAVAPATTTAASRDGFLPASLQLPRTVATGPSAPAPQTAAPAPVAEVAQVARVATVATPGAGAAGISAAHTHHASVARDTTMTERMRPAASARHTHDESSPHYAKTSRPPAAATASAAADGSGQPVAGVTPQAPESVALHTSAASQLADAAGPDLAARIARVLQVQDALHTRPAHHVSLEVENGPGAAARIHVGLRGGELATRIDVSDPAVALRLEHRLGELRGALQRQGLEPLSIRVGALEHARMDMQSRTGQSLTGLIEAASTASIAAEATARGRGFASHEHEPHAERRSHGQPHGRSRRDTSREETT